MKKLFVSVFLLALLLSFDCVAQKIITARYLRSNYEFTQNSSFMRREMKFVSDNSNDTLYVNVRLPLKLNINKFNDTISVEVFNWGVYHNCHLEQDSIYILILKRICVNDIPEWQHSYYRTNAIFDENDCSRFVEFENNTPFQYAGYVGEYVDVKGILYRIVGLEPNTNCFFP